MKTAEWAGSLRYHKPPFMRRSFSRVARSLQLWLALGVGIAVVALASLGYLSIQEWRRNAALLASRRTGETADLFVRALERDMQAVQTNVLVSANWDASSLDSPNDLRTFVASAFARYPYPESFFAARQLTDPGQIVFFNRTTRPPRWLGATGKNAKPFPVSISTESAMASRFAERISRDVVLGRRFSLFEFTFEGTTYQVVTRLLYRDPTRQRFDGILGFTVNLDWAAHHYFADLTQQMANVGDVRDGFTLRVRDENDAVVASSSTIEARPISRRTFPLVFFDPSLAQLDPPADLMWRRWTVEVQDVSDKAPNMSIQSTNRTLAISTLAGTILAVGLILTATATRTHARLSEMRDEFVSGVTHELKTPIATIRAAGDTLFLGRFTRSDAPRHYAGLIVQESKRLSRLIDNLLAFARITDVTEAYWFETVCPSELVAAALDRFEGPLTEKGFQVQVDASVDLPPVQADRVSMELLLDNVIDNAIRYSTDRRALTVSAIQRSSSISIEVRDLGPGIPPDELPNVTRRFFRGRHAASGGSGLGLAIAARIAKDHGGRLLIESALGRGTTVRIVLPIAVSS